ncbi:MAG: DUF1800 family protein, partial [Actinobacteria bacterium]|nr:DUF1800 family protein [Actinomycetota bacterium]
MVRTRRPLVERMTLVWHDWFATSRDGVQANLLLRQNELFRRHALGNFGRLLQDVTHDPAMLVWLSGDENTRWSPNENYTRELMELFTLGADRGYSERDVREQARALTGWTDETRCKASRSTITCSPRSQPGACPSPQSSPRRSTTSGRAACGAPSRSGCSMRSEGSRRRSRVATQLSCRRPPPRTRPTSSAASSQRSRGGWRPACLSTVSPSRHPA